MKMIKKLTDIVANFHNGEINEPSFREHASAWTNFGLVLCRHVVSLSHYELHHNLYQGIDKLSIHLEVVCNDSSML